MRICYWGHCRLCSVTDYVATHQLLSRSTPFWLCNVIIRCQVLDTRAHCRYPVVQRRNYNIHLQKPYRPPACIRNLVASPCITRTTLIGQVELMHFIWSTCTFVTMPTYMCMDTRTRCSLTPTHNDYMHTTRKCDNAICKSSNMSHHLSIHPYRDDFVATSAPTHTRVHVFDTRMFCYM